MREELRRPPRQKDPLEAFRAQVQTALNKLTVDNFKKLSDQLLVTLRQAKTVELLDEAVSIFHKKVLSDSKFTSMYVDLMKLINKDLDPIKDPVTNKPVHFRGLCLNKCQETFESSLDPPTSDQVADYDELDRQLKAGVVNVLFLAELSKAGLLPPKLLMACLETMLAKIKSGLESRSVFGSYQAEVNSERLSKVLLLFGEAIAQKEVLQFQLSSLASEIEQLSKWPGLTSRHLYFLLDIVDANQNNWARRRVVEGPQTIVDLHTKAYLNSDPLMASSSKLAEPSQESSLTKSSGSVNSTSPSSGTAKRTVVRRVVLEQESPSGKK
jgi:hypothetical protein